MVKQQITDELEALFSVLPDDIADAVRRADRNDDLLEVVMDLGRKPEARYVDGDIVLKEREVTREDLDYVVSRIGQFTSDNRAGIERTLHRISAIRNRQGKIVGLTCRVGRAVYGTIDIIQDIVESGKNILLLGRPGVGKTTLLREAARVLAEKKRVIIVDTSNEIGGDGDIPHPAIGKARRMQVPSPELQHEVMIEAVENHMPEVIIIDEIGREQEAAAARTIAERGVQLIGTAHGNTLDNLLLNPTLSDLVGGIQTVTLSDEEARRRGTQKTVLERKAPPTFDVLVEMQDRQHLIVHHSVAEAVDARLRGQTLPAERRYRDENDRIHIEKAMPSRPTTRKRTPAWQGFGEAEREPRSVTHGRPMEPEWEAEEEPRMLKPVRIYPYGIGQNRLRKAAQNMHLPVSLVNDLGAADVVITLKNYYRKQTRPIIEAEERGIPVYVLRSNTVTQMEQSLADIFDLTPEAPGTRLARAMEETQEAIRRVLAGEPSVDLSPQAAYIRKRQHEMARAAHLVSHSYGREPHRRVRIFRD
jgi:stage III sporulation protein SpoIIIAA